MRFVLIDFTTKLVTNVILWNLATWTPPSGTIVIQSDTANIGDLYDAATGTFTTPN